MDGLDPWAYPDIDCLCRPSSIIATCDKCGFATVGGAHLGVAFYGMYCARCCPACDGSFTITLEEFLQVAKNREDARVRSDARKRSATARSPEWRKDHGQKMRAYWAKRRTRA